MISYTATLNPHYSHYVPPLFHRIFFKGSCGDGDVRLVDGPKFTAYQEGRLEMCIDGEWLAVCGNSWTEENTQVVCRTL